LRQGSETLPQINGAWSFDLRLVPELLRKKIEPRLGVGERIIYICKPSVEGYRRFLSAHAPKAILLLIFGLIWLIGIGNVSRMETTPPLFFRLFGPFCILLGIWLWSSPMRARSHAENRTYVITDRQVMVFGRLSLPTEVCELPYVHRIEIRNRFENRADLYVYCHDPFNPSSRLTCIALIDIANPEVVAEILKPGATGPRADVREDRLVSEKH